VETERAETASAAHFAAIPGRTCYAVYSRWTSWSVPIAAGGWDPRRDPSTRGHLGHLAVSGPALARPADRPRPARARLPGVHTDRLVVRPPDPKCLDDEGRCVSTRRRATPRQPRHPTAVQLESPATRVPRSVPPHAAEAKLTEQALPAPQAQLEPPMRCYGTPPPGQAVETMTDPSLLNPYGPVPQTLRPLMR